MYSTRPNTVSLALARDNRPAIKSGRGSDFNFAACGTDAFTATASNNLTDARWRICGIGSDAEQIESGVTKLITFFPPSLSLSFAHPIVHQFCPFSSLPFHRFSILQHRFPLLRWFRFRTIRSAVSSTPLQVKRCNRSVSSRTSLV